MADLSAFVPRFPSIATILVNLKIGCSYNFISKAFRQPAEIYPRPQINPSQAAVSLRCKLQLVIITEILHINRVSCLRHTQPDLSNYNQYLPRRNEQCPVIRDRSLSWGNIPILYPGANLHIFGEGNRQEYGRLAAFSLNQLVGQMKSSKRCGAVQLHPGILLSRFFLFPIPLASSPSI